MAVLERFTTIASSTGISRTARTSTLSIQSFEKERGRRWLDSGIRFSANILGDNPAASSIRPECDRNVRRSILAPPPEMASRIIQPSVLGPGSEHKTTKVTKGHEGKAIRISFLRELRVLCGSLNFGRVVAAKFIRFSLSPGGECAAQQRSRAGGCHATHSGTDHRKGSQSIRRSLRHWSAGTRKLEHDRCLQRSSFQAAVHSGDARAKRRPHCRRSLPRHGPADCCLYLNRPGCDEHNYRTRNRALRFDRAASDHWQRCHPYAWPRRNAGA